MKKIGLKILAIMLATFISVTYVKADTTEDNLVYQSNKEIIENIYNDLMIEYQSVNYPYYSILFAYAGLDNNYQVQDNSQSYITGFLYYFEENNNYSSDIGRIYIDYRCRPDCTYSTYRELKTNGNYGGFNSSLLELQNTFINYAGNLLLQNGENPDYFINSVNGQYIEVYLDNYEYVLLSLKDYSQTEAFQTNLQVKGQIGITPIYNFGQTSKDAVTGSQVQDRCNLSYSDYTSYPFYIIQSDLQNNAIFAIKECSNGSSFKFDNTIFNITYITSENKDNPTVTIGGKTYNVIPYEDLPSTATKNEEDNYIPGESGYPLSEGLDSAIKNVQQKMSEIWNIFTYFTDFVGQLFSSLPAEVQTILLSAFIVAIILGLIKIFIN